MLDARNIRTNRESYGLAPKQLGLFKIIKDFGNKAYKLDLTAHDELNKIYLVFYLWLLHLVDGYLLPG
jgi:hypothetical protein